MDSTACTDVSGLCHQLQTNPTRDQARIIFQTIGHSYSSYATPANPSQQLYHRRDAIAQQLLPNETQNLQPIVVEGDGNCLFRSFSTLFKGNKESDHLELRLRTALELITNENYYVDLCKRRASEVAKQTAFSTASCPSVFLSEQQEFVCLLVLLGKFVQTKVSACPVQQFNLDFD